MASIPQQLGKLMRLIPEQLRNLVKGAESSTSAEVIPAAEALAAAEAVATAGAVAAAQPEPAAGFAGLALERQQADAITQLVFLPRDHQWAYCFWTISASDQARAQAAAAGSLCLRLADVTGLVNPEAKPHALREVIVAADAHEWFMPVPLADRDYRVELGYRLNGGGWLSLAFSAVARMPADVVAKGIAQQFEPFFLDLGVVSAPTNSAELSSSSGGVLHEQLYQQATGGMRLKSRGSEAFHEYDFELSEGATAPNANLNDSGAGVWASGRNESGAGSVARPRSFWLVADAELIVYGATDPSATLTIGDQVVPLKSDGTFRLHVPFKDGQQLYPIFAVAADGDQKRSISLEFTRETPHANVNSKSDAVTQWL
jgi:hypothetical protein